jgi:hypothetical protein
LDHNDEILTEIGAYDRILNIRTIITNGASS